MNTNNDVLIAAIFTAVGGLFSQVIAAILKRGELQIGSEASLRKEYSERLDKQDARIGVLETSLDDWKKKYYDLQGQYIVLEAEKIALQHKVDDMQKEINDLKTQLEKVKKEQAQGKTNEATA